MTVDVNKEVGSRITKLLIGDVEYDPERIYTVASTEFIRKGGDGE